MNQEQSEQQVVYLLRSSAEDLGVAFWGSEQLMSDETYFGYAKIFFDSLKRIYEQKWMCKWMPDAIERAYFCVKVLGCWVTCIKHAGIDDINYLLTKDGDILLRQLMENLLCDMPAESQREWDSLLGQQIFTDVTEV